ncbi:DUF1206 domain-containing protein [Sphingomonas sp. 2R-10]|uniref:DUF1206 domain-containing protein n=1 Tax=Sphingomonas sp. 2R-10 TaxID=3045148 RepID=UPI0013DE4607|nr:DUF1206 domain-containing protein [Sphingomonas sp. 2R-10]MDJ0275805.1 DUF1206 domain-containing protein [Sphingomonas sp. 2R-10]
MSTRTGATLLARLGFAARGIVYCIVGWFAIDAALRGGKAGDNQGAIASLADEPFGEWLLAAMAAGLAGYALWRLTEALFDPEAQGRDAKGAFRRAGHAVSGIAHVVLAWTAARLTMHSARATGRVGGEDSAQDWTAWMLDQPGGQLLVALVAIALLAAAAQQAKKAWTGEFARTLSGGTPVPGYVCTMGRIGYGARAAVFAAIAVLFVGAAWAADADAAGGMASGMALLQRQAGGQLLLTAIGIGFIAFGAFSFVEARWRRLQVRLPA